MAWAIGANNAGNTFCASVGANIIKPKNALILIVVFSALGATLQGHLTGETIGTGIISLNALTNLNIILSLFNATMIVTIFTFFGLPISTTQAIIGSLIGTAFAAAQWKNIISIYLLGFVNPLFALMLSYIIYKIILKITKDKELPYIEQISKIILILSSLFLAYSLGANDIGNAIGLLLARDIASRKLIGLLGGIALGIGVLTLGKRVLVTLSTKITILDPFMAFSSQLGAAIAVYLFTLLKIPTTTSFAIVAGIIGVGLVKGVQSINKGIVNRIVFAWVFSPIIAGISSFIILNIIGKF